MQYLLEGIQVQLAKVADGFYFNVILILEVPWEVPYVGLFRER
jgi:hypothetical protein